MIHNLAVGMYRAWLGSKCVNSTCTKAIIDIQLNLFMSICFGKGFSIMASLCIFSVPFLAEVNETAYETTYEN